MPFLSSLGFDRSLLLPFRRHLWIRKIDSQRKRTTKRREEPQAWETLSGTGNTRKSAEIRPEMLCRRRVAVTFSGHSSLKLIGVTAFWRCGLARIRIPSSVNKIHSGCYCKCDDFRGVEIGNSPSLRRIGVSVLSGWHGTVTAPASIAQSIQNTGLTDCNHLTWDRTREMRGKIR